MNTETTGLFTEYETLPTTVKYILDTFGPTESYKQAEELLDLLRPLGYTFSYGLDSQPHTLQKIILPEDTTQDLLDEICAVALRACLIYKNDADYVGWDNIHEGIRLYKNHQQADYVVFVVELPYDGLRDFEVLFSNSFEVGDAQITAPLQSLAWSELNILHSRIKNLY